MSREDWADTLAPLIRLNTGECNSCGAAVIWAEYPPTGKVAPLVPVPDPANPPVSGTWRLEAMGAHLIYSAAKGEPRYVSHFATCPHPEQHRRTRVREHERRVPDRVASRRERDEGVERVASRPANEAFKAWAADTIRALAAFPEAFTSDDLERLRQEEKEPEPAHRNAIGAAFNAAARRGEIVAVGYTQTALVPGHARTIKVWKGTRHA